MNAGKSTALLQAAYNYNEKNQEVMLFTSATDTRYGTGKITSRMGASRDAHVFNHDTKFSEIITRGCCACVLIDESQFLSREQVNELHRIVHLQDMPVMCYGLRADFQGNAFQGSAQLLALADHLEELRTVCACGSKASMNARIDEAGNRVHEGVSVLIGGNETYRSECPTCFYQGMQSA